MTVDRRDAERELMRGRLAELRDEILPAAAAARLGSRLALIDALRQDPLGVALLNAVASQVRFYRLSLDANSIAQMLGEPAREVDQMLASIPDPAALLTDVVQSLAVDSVADEQEFARAAIESALEPAEPLDHAQQMQLERQRAYEDHRIISVLHRSEAEVAAMTEADRAAAFAEAQQVHDQLQERQRQMFAGYRSPRANASGFRGVHGS